MPSSVDYAFPAVDSATVTELGTVDNSAINPKGIISSITSGELSSLNQSFNSAEGSGQNVLTYAMMLSRNKTIDSVASDLTERNMKMRGGLKDTYTRQGEINEWQAQNKLDTLFFLQLTFLFFTAMVIMIFLRQYGFMTTGMIWVLGIFLLLILVGTLWNRLSYTMYSRDGKYWNRRFIGLSDSGLSATSATCQ